MVVFLLLATSAIHRAVHAIAAVEVLHAEFALAPALQYTRAASMGLRAALQKVGACVVEFTAADADVACVSIVRTRLALSLVAAHVWLAAHEVGVTLFTLTVALIIGFLREA